MSEDVYIVGIDMIKFGRFPDQTVPQLGAEAPPTRSSSSI